MEWSDNRRTDKEKKTVLEQLSFTEIKKLVDEGYERFWDVPHRRALKPKNCNFGAFSFGKQDSGNQYDNFDDLT